MSTRSNDSGVKFTPQLLHHDNVVKEVVSSQPSIMWYKSANQILYSVCKLNNKYIPYIVNIFMDGKN